MSETPLSSGWVLREPDNRRVVELGRQIREWLDPAEWASWDLRTRIRFVAAAHGWVRSAYGLDERQLLFEELPPEVHGRFEITTGEVSVNRDLLLEDDPLPLLETLAHENRHAVQAGWLDWAGATPGATSHAGTPVADTELALWQHGMATYDTRDFDNYWYNAIEVDAREAGHNLTAGYQRRDSELLREQLRQAAPTQAPTPAPTPTQTPTPTLTPARRPRGVWALRRRFGGRRGREGER